MQSSVGRSLVWAVFLLTGLIVFDKSSTAASCALYARAETGVYLYGDAGGWWGEAAERYRRGHVPQTGSILVFRRTRHMPAGHVAVVSAIIGPDEILVDQANWRRGVISHGTPVVDTSPHHDWTMVAVMNTRSMTWGRENPSFGFVYPETGPRNIVATARRGDAGSAIESRTAYEPPAGEPLADLAGSRRKSRRRGRGIPGVATRSAGRVLAATARD